MEWWEIILVTAVVTNTLINLHVFIFGRKFKNPFFTKKGDTKSNTEK